mmetsp:Transcript_2677/g.2330  ORF Transcript_2677/g.2330 Transcript_2677/m.2330 type:complete len:86 (-) Transcript_2677:291-548(-)
MPREKFYELFDNFTNADSDSHFKLDDFIKNPAPPNVPLSAVLKKIGSLLSNGMNFEVSYEPNEDNALSVNCVGQYMMRPEGSDND